MQEEICISKQEKKKKKSRLNLRDNLPTLLYFTFQLVSYGASQKHQFLKQTLSIHSQIHCNYSDIAGIKTLMKIEELLV